MAKVDDEIKKVKGELCIVSIKDIKVSNRFRKDYGDIDQLIESVKEKGIIQPISLNKNMELAAGGRRYMAAVGAGLKEIPAIIRDTADEIDKLEIELFENIHRKDMAWHEEVELTQAINSLYEKKFGKEVWSGRKTASIMNKSVGKVSEDVQLAKAMEKVPALKDIKTRKDALKLLKKTEKNMQIQQAHEEQKERIKKSGNDFLSIADANFRIGDCIKGMKELAAQYKKNKTASMIKFAEVDPPYAIDLAELKKVEGIKPDELDKYKEIDKKNYPAFLMKVAKALYDVMAEDSWVIFWFGPTWFCEVKAALIAAGFEVDDIPGIWTKPTGQTQQPAYHLGSAYEPFFIAKKGKPKLRKEGRINVFNYVPVSAQNKYHPTQRPINLIREIIETFTWPGTIGIVPFLGSGTTLRAFYKEGIMGFGWELNEHNKASFMLKVEEDLKEGDN